MEVAFGYIGEILELGENKEISDVHNETGGSIFEYEVALDSAFSKYENLGIHTVKTGYAAGKSRQKIP